MTVRFAVIGAGVMGADHARILAEDLPGAVLQLVCDRDADRARTLADTLGATDVGTDPMAAITRADVDALIVASPDHTHASLTRACISARKPVLCEKPLSPVSGACIDVMVDEQAAGLRLVQLGFMRRYDQSYVEMKAALDGGALGAAIMMHNFHRNVETPAAGFTVDMAITNSAPHEFDVARHVLGTEYGAITAFSAYGAAGKIRVKAGPVFMVLETTGGQLVNIEINNNAAYGYDVRGELVCEKGAVSLADPVHSRLDSGLTRQTRYAADWRPRYAEAYRRQNRVFLRFVQSGVFCATAASAWDGYAAAIVAEAGVRSLEEGRKIVVEMLPKPEFYA